MGELAAVSQFVHEAAVGQISSDIHLCCFYSLLFQLKGFPSSRNVRASHRSGSSRRRSSSRSSPCTSWGTPCTKRLTGAALSPSRSRWRPLRNSGAWNVHRHCDTKLTYLVLPRRKRTGGPGSCRTIAPCRRIPSLTECVQGTQVIDRLLTLTLKCK